MMRARALRHLACLMALALAGTAAADPIPVPVTADSLPAGMTVEETPPVALARFFAMTFRAEPGVTGRIVLNGLEIVAFDGDGVLGSSSEPQDWLMPGLNVLRLEARMAAGAAAAAPAVSIGLHGLAQRGLVEDGNRFFHLTWSPPAPVLTEKTFFVNTVLPSALWREVQAVAALADADRAAILDKARQVVAAVNGGDGEALTALFRYRLEDRVRSLSLGPEALQRMRDGVARMAGRTVIALADDADLVLRPLAGGKVFRLERQDGSPGLFEPGKTKAAALDLFFARVGEDWVIVR